jgi:hypothetical protein
MYSAENVIHLLKGKSIENTKIETEKRKNEKNKKKYTEL